MSLFGDDSQLRRMLHAAFEERPTVPAWLDVGGRTGPARNRLRWQQRRQELEAHVRLSVVDRVLRALGWALGPTAGDDLDWVLQNLSIEVPVRPAGTRYRKRLDYFGFDSAERHPLLLVETKPPDLELEAYGVHPAEHPWIPYLAAAASAVQQRKARRLIGGLSERWHAAVEQLRQYVISIAALGPAPRRALLTNGHWFVVFCSPSDSFVTGEGASAGRATIVVFESPRVVLSHLGTFRELLEYRGLTDSVPAISAAEVGSYVDRSAVSVVVHGLQVLRAEDAKWDERVPRLEASPLLLLLTRTGNSLVVRGGSPFREVPFGNDGRMREHLLAVQRDAIALRRAVMRYLELRLPDPSPVRELVRSGVHLLVRRVGPEATGVSRFYVLTGDRTHFIVPTSEYRGCDGHTFARLTSRSKNALPTPIVRPALAPRAFFVDRSVLHCMQVDVCSARRSPVQREPIDERGGDEGREAKGATCFLLLIEEHFCCRSCAFGDICLTSSVLRGVASAACQATTRGGVVRAQPGRRRPRR